MFKFSKKIYQYESQNLLDIQLEIWSSKYEGVIYHKDYRWMSY